MEGLGLENCVGAPSMKGHLKGEVLLCPFMKSMRGGRDSRREPQEEQHGRNAKQEEHSQEAKVSEVGR